MYSPPPWNDFGHAVEVRSMTAEDIEHFEQALAAWGGAYESETYEGASHGWTVPDKAATMVRRSQ